MSWTTSERGPAVAGLQSRFHGQGLAQARHWIVRPPSRVCQSHRVAPKGQKNEEIAWLCDGNWRLPEQAEALAAWLAEHCATLNPGEYVADIGITSREDASGGGAAFAPETLRMMADLGMSLFISEYGCSQDKAD